MFTATPKQTWNEWDYQQGDPIIRERSISIQRYKHLMSLNHTQKDNFKLSLHDPETNNWTKWVSIWDHSIDQLQNSFDIHRSLLDNEIIIESDYPSYEDNYEAARFIGTMLEDKGYIPHYYYSGSKSIHIHLFIDYKLFIDLPEELQLKLRAMWKTKPTFLKRFAEFIREKLISCWGMNMRDFDTDLIKATHLIRSELSRNKLGYKTFLGYSHSDIPPIPYICNETNRIYPILGEIKLSRPPEFQSICEEFIERAKKKPRKRNNHTLMDFSEENRNLLPCVKYLLSDEFCASTDGRNRAMFILANELKRVYGEDGARVALVDWNLRLGEPITQQEIDYRLKQTKNYTITCKYMSALFRELGIQGPCQGCKKRKV